MALFWTLSLLLFLRIALLNPVNSFYLPGVAPRDFAPQESVFIKVNKLISTKNQLPYGYYSLPFCKPEHLRSKSENIGEVLRGDRILSSPYEIKIQKNESCNILCRIASLTEKESKAFKIKIEDEYKVTMILDNLPVAQVGMRQIQGKEFKVYIRGYPVGFKLEDGRYCLNNHLNFNILFHLSEETYLARIVGFEVVPLSKQHTYEKDWNDDDKNQVLETCDPQRMIMISDNFSPMIVETGKEVIFTYSVEFQESSIKWASRWDTYLMMVDGQIHWFSVINSLMIVLFLSGMVAIIMLRTLHRDIVMYNEMQTADEAMEETGWKLVHGDVFRPPVNNSLFATYVGVGVQIFGMIMVTMIFALLGFLSPANRGALTSAMLFLFASMGVCAGYCSSMLYKSFKGTEWKKMTFQTAFMFPGVVFAVFFLLNILLAREKSTGAVPLSTMISLFALWFGLSAPLVFLGSYYGFKTKVVEFPVRTNKIPRQVPEQPWYMKPLFSCMIGGILPFGAVFIELFFVLSSIWLNQFYYLFGFLSLVFIILILTCAEISVVLCYFQLCNEDYHWWWRSYFSSGSSSLFLFLYCMYYFTKLDISGFVSVLMYFSYMAIMSYGFFCLTGTIGFYACYFFVRKIYSVVKFD